MTGGHFGRLLSIGIDGWQFAAVGISLILIATSVVRTAHSVQDATETKSELDRLLARTIADAHAHDFTAHVGCPPKRVIGGFRSEIESFEESGRRRLSIRVGTATQEISRFECEVLDGALPSGLRRPLTLPSEVSDLVETRLLTEMSGVEFLEACASGSRLPSVDIDGLQASAISAASRFAFRCDSKVAFRYSSVGTDRLDYVLRADRDDDVVRLSFGPSGVLVLDGNLWLESPTRPLRIELERPGTLLVRGNVYVGESVEILGPESASLVVFALRAEGANWVESSGCVRFGLGDTKVYENGLCLDLSLVVENKLVLGRRGAPTRISGALAVGGAVELAAADVAAFRATGRRLPDPRVRLPAVVVRGGPRPGRIAAIERPGD